MLRSPSARRRPAVVLLAVLIVIVVLSLAAYKYNDWMVAEARANDSALRASQARAFALSGVHYTAALLAAGIDTTLGSNPYDNSGSFQDIEVPSSHKHARAGKFSVISLRAPDEISAGGQAYRFGVVDESGKINLNALLDLDGGKGDVGLQILMGLPNMTEDVANSILDWLDPDDTPRDNGAEVDYYSTLSPPYKCKNGPLDSLEELLLVKGVTPQLLYGNDKNRNGVLDKDEDDGSGQVDLGWQAYLTVYSREANVDPTGAARVYLNGSDLNTTITNLGTTVSQEVIDYIAACRLYGSSSIGGKGGSSGGSGSGTTTTTTTKASSGDLAAAKAKIQQDIGSSSGKKLKNISSLWDLVNSQVSVSVGTGQTAKTVNYPSPLNDPATQRDQLPKLLDYCTTSSNPDLTPRININTAPQAVVMALQTAANLQDADMTAILGKRPAVGDSTTSDPVYKTTTWLLTEVNLPVSTVKKLDTYITGRSQVYRFQVVGYFDKGGPSARVEAVVDTNLGRPRIIYYRNVSELGKGFDVGSGEH
jgi:type II secretory pathway component PulK